MNTAVGMAMSAKNLTARSFKPLLKSAGMHVQCAYALRHIYATLPPREGVHPKLVQELLGHDTISQTMDTYSHVLPGMRDRTAVAMERALP